MAKPLHQDTPAKARFCDTVIYICSKSKNVEWLRCEENSSGCCSPKTTVISFCNVTEEEVYMNPQMAWLVEDARRQGSPEAVQLRSVKYPDYILMVKGGDSYGLTASELDSALWFIVKNADDDTFCIEQKSSTGTNPKKLIMHRQPISEHMELIFSQENLTKMAKIKATYKKMEGIVSESGDNISKQVSIDLKKRLEMDGNHSEWRVTKPITWYKFETPMEDECSVNPETRVVIYQLVGKYGPYKVRSSTYSTKVSKIV